MSHLPFVREPGSPSRQRRCMAGALAAVAACFALQAPVDALAATASIGVSARVLARTRVETTIAPAVLAVTPQDVQRGWVEVSEPVVLTVRSNAQRGPTLFVFTASDLVRESVITGFSDPVSFGAGQGAIQLPPQQPADPVRYQLAVRLHLAAGVQPGEYAFPVRFGSIDGETVSAASR